MLNNDADAEDVTQDVLLQVIVQLDTFRGEADVGTWLHRVTVNAALARPRQAARRQEHEIHEQVEKFDGNGYRPGVVRPWSVGPDQQALEQERQEIIERASLSCRNFIAMCTCCRTWRGCRTPRSVTSST